MSGTSMDSHAPRGDSGASGSDRTRTGAGNWRRSCVECTLRAVDQDGTLIVFVDYVNEGQRVDLWRDPDKERGFLGGRIVYRDETGWRLRELTDEERSAHAWKTISRAANGSTATSPLKPEAS